MEHMERWEAAKRLVASTPYEHDVTSMYYWLRELDDNVELMRTLIHAEVVSVGFSNIPVAIGLIRKQKAGQP